MKTVQAHQSVRLLSDEMCKEHQKLKHNETWHISEVCRNVLLQKIVKKSKCVIKHKEKTYDWQCNIVTFPKPARHKTSQRHFFDLHLKNERLTSFCL